MAELMRSQKNALFETIKQVGLDPSGFEWQTVGSHQDPSERVSKIRHRDTDYYFIFEENFGAVYAPGEYSSHAVSVHRGSSGAQRGTFRKRLSYLHREISQPDLWAEMSKYQLLAEEQLSPETSNEPFTAYQVERILSSIREIRTYLAAHVVQGRKQAFADERLDYLTEAAKR